MPVLAYFFSYGDVAVGLDTRRYSVFWPAATVFFSCSDWTLTGVESAVPSFALGGNGLMFYRVYLPFIFHTLILIQRFIFFHSHVAKNSSMKKQKFAHEQMGGGGGVGRRRLLLLQLLSHAMSLPAARSSGRRGRWEEEEAALSPTAPWRPSWR